MNIQKTGGDPTAAPAIRVRGTTSLTGGNDPLVIIDGVFGDLNMLNAISPADIENFTVLKDASETAQYGSRGASGVIVVTTIKGKNGVKTLSYDGSFGVETVYKNLEMLDANTYRQVVADRGYANALDMGYDTNFIEAMQQTGYTQNHRLLLEVVQSRLIIVLLLVLLIKGVSLRIIICATIQLNWMLRKQCLMIR